MPELLRTCLIVCPLVFLAGFVDSVAGGGGIISLSLIHIFEKARQSMKFASRPPAARVTAECTVKSDFAFI